MIIARKIKTEEELKSSYAIMNDYNIIECEHDEKDIKYILIEDDKVKGVCRVSCEDNIGILEYICVDKGELGSDLGDALLRSTFNNCLNQDIKKIYFKSKNTYLLKKGFKEREFSYKNINYLIEIDLEEFFNTPCQHCKH